VADGLVGIGPTRHGGCRLIFSRGDADDACSALPTFTGDSTVATASKQDKRSGTASTPMPGTPAESSTPIEGEGSYTAARRHRKSVEDFDEDDRVDKAAADAEPDSAEEAEEMRKAEDEGRRHARK
jgi:hypothetical protein